MENVRQKKASEYGLHVCMLARVKSTSLDMDSLSLFMKEVYVAKPDSRLTVKDIYEDFRAWIIGKYDMATWNKISQRQVYTALKGLPEYPYVRFKEGYCLKGIIYRQDKSINKEKNVVSAKPTPDQTVHYLTLSIIDEQYTATKTLYGSLYLPQGGQAASRWRAPLATVIKDSDVVNLPCAKTEGNPTQLDLVAEMPSVVPIISPNEMARIQYICPRIQGVILPTLGQKTSKK